MITLNKGLTGAAKATVILVALIVSMFFIYNFIMPTTASESTPTIWTADPNGQPKTDFSPEETVYVEGENFSASSLVNISVTRPNGVVDTGSETTDPYGSFEYEYALDGITGFYDVFATDGINTAIISFNDSAGAIWTTKNDCGNEQQDINHYNKGDHVFINGAGFGSGSKSWSIKGTPGSCDSDTVVASGNVNINSSGSFCFDAYTVKDDDCGVYQVKVDTKGDNYQVGDWCVNQLTEKKCGDADCLWCNQCKYDVSTTKTNQWLTGTCVIPGTDCGWHCEKNYCGATCSNGLDCSCPKDKCVGSDYYDYPLNGTCKDCTTSCYCENGTNSGQPCYPAIIKNDSRCLCGNGIINPGEECEIGNKESKQCGTDIGVCEFGSKERECAQSCKWGNWSECKGGINPQPEICDGLDNDCGGHVDEGCCPSYSCLTPDELGDTQQENIKHGNSANDDLQKLLDSYGYAINATEDQTNDQIWHIGADTVNIQIELVGKGAADNSNVFGYYLNGNASNFTPLFQMGNHSVYHVPVFTHGQKINITIKNAQDIGFGINSENKNKTQRYLYLTQNSSNPDSKDHAVVFDLCNNTYMIGFEDLYNLGDSDYEDLVVVVRVINCISGPVCGDSTVNPPEECELPKTIDNPFCAQTTTDCLGKKFGQRDAHGNCDEFCGCIDDPFQYSCVKDKCGAECDKSEDCQNECVGNIRYYSGSCDLLTTCACSYSSENCDSQDNCYAYGNGCEDRDYFCQAAGCNYTFSNRHTDYNDSFVNYCSVDAIRTHRTLNDFFCDGTCKDHTGWVDDQLVQDCNLQDGWYNTSNNQWISTGQCAEKEQLQQEYRNYTCGPVIGVQLVPTNVTCTYTVTNHQWIDTGKTRNKDDGTSCDDGLYCTGPDTCTAGVCGGPARDCSSLNDQCQEGVCNDDLNACVPDYIKYPLSTPCEADNSLCTIDHCNGKGSCVNFDNVPVPPSQDCKSFYCDPVDGKVKEDYTNYPLSTPCQADDNLCTIDHCDGSGSCVFLKNVVVPPTEQCKSFYCEPLTGFIRENYTGFPLSTPCESDNNECTIDHCSGSGDCIFWKNVTAPSAPAKRIGDPKTKCQDGEWCEYKITTLTEIALSCQDGANVSWRYALDGEWNEWHNDMSPTTIRFPEESNHTLEAYCLSECGESSHDIEKFKVEGKAFEIPLYKKWNLISVPFVLLNKNISEVFKNISDEINSVWTFHDGQWYLWQPELDGTLEKIEAGWGYWVLAKNDTKLLISGNLFSPTITPPSKDLQEGWNLIGYYGTEWQTYQIESDNCGYDDYKYGNYVYCSLNSLIDTQEGFPRWSSLWGFDNCGNDNTSWHALDSCVGEQWSENKMFAGKGYWIEMDVQDSYAPASNCMFNKEFKCSPITL